MTPKAQATKAKINNWDYIKLHKSFSTAKEMINKQTAYGVGEYICTHLSDEGSILKKNNKELIQINSKPLIIQLKEAKNLNRHFPTKVGSLYPATLWNLSVLAFFVWSL